MPSATYEFHPNTCCICQREHGLVWNVPRYANLWVHLTCAIKVRQQAKQQLAEYHLAAARQHGAMLIGQTQKGTVRLSYNQGDRTYALDQMPTRAQEPQAVRLAHGQQSTVQPVLIDLYVEQAE
jgi:hypothetical protein